MDEQGLSPEGDDFEAEDNVLPLPAEELTESQLRALVSAGGNPAGLLTPLQQQQQHAPTGRPGGSHRSACKGVSNGSEGVQSPDPQPSGCLQELGGARHSPANSARAAHPV